MANKERKGCNQKLKMLYLAEIFSEESDEQNTLTVAEIIEKLAACGVNANRKTLYIDFDELRKFGLDIIKTPGNRYYLGARQFELPELKLLVDSVQSAKFISDKKSSELIKKLESLASKHEGRKLHRQVVISGRVKTMNESIYYNVDKLHEAIGEGRQIRFKYYQWNVKKEMELRRGGDWYQLSPWALVWDSEYYYLIAYDPKSDGDKIKHYRVDKMKSISLTEEMREGQEEFKKFDMARYSKTLFGMFGGEETRVTIEAPNDMVGIFIDRFGKDIFIVPLDGERFQTTVSVAVSNQFLGWIMALGGGVKILGPDAVVERMRAEVRRLCTQYL
ncbi:MAG TPA: WYL domain-containing protein [Bacillota bacterium]|nr:WYL domain-containing protein [Bacillota bacterium]